MVGDLCLSPALAAQGRGATVIRFVLWIMLVVAVTLTVMASILSRL